MLMSGCLCLSRLSLYVLYQQAPKAAAPTPSKKESGSHPAFEIDDGRDYWAYTASVPSDGLYPSSGEPRAAYDRLSRRDYYAPGEYDNNAMMPSGMHGGTAIIYAGAVVSMTGLKHNVKFHHGLIEHVAMFDSTPLTVGQYESLPSDVPHVKPNGYKIVFMGDEGSGY